MKGDNVLYHIRNNIAKDEFSGKYTIISPETQEAYLFNRFGLHLHTVNLITDKMKFNFTYNGNSAYGKLITVTDQKNVLLNVKRNFHGRAELIQTINNEIKIKLNNFEMLKTLIIEANRTSYSFTYVGNTGLLKSKSENNDKTFLFNYQKNGKIEQIVDADQILTNITYFLNSNGIITTLNKGNHFSETWISNSSATYVYKSN